MQIAAVTSAEPACTLFGHDDRVPPYRAEGMDLAHTRFLTLPEGAVSG